MTVVEAGCTQDAHEHIHGTKSAQAVLRLQKLLPNARVVYVSATGASEPEHLLYASRLGLWGTGTSFSDSLQFAKEIKVVMEERRLRTDDQPHALVYEKMMSVAYQSHPYRNPIVGWMNDLENMSVDDAHKWYDRWYAPNNAVLVVVGDVDPKEVYSLAQKYYGEIKSRPIASLALRKPQTEVTQAGIKRLQVKAPA